MIRLKYRLDNAFRYASWQRSSAKQKNPLSANISCNNKSKPTIWRGCWPYDWKEMTNPRIVCRSGRYCHPQDMAVFWKNIQPKSFLSDLRWQKNAKITMLTAIKTLLPLRLSENKMMKVINVHKIIKNSSLLIKTVTGSIQPDPQWFKNSTICSSILLFIIWLILEKILELSFLGNFPQSTWNWKSLFKNFSRIFCWFSLINGIKHSQSKLWNRNLLPNCSKLQDKITSQFNYFAQRFQNKRSERRHFISEAGKIFRVFNVMRCREAKRAMSNNRNYFQNRYDTRERADRAITS